MRHGELPDVSWFNPAGAPVDWSNGEQSLTCIFGAPLPVESPPAAGNANQIASNIKLAKRPHVLLMLNPIGQPREFQIPDLVRMIKWRKFIDTSAPSPADIYPSFDGPAPPLQGPIVLAERSLVCYVAGE